MRSMTLLVFGMFSRCMAPCLLFFQSFSPVRPPPIADGEVTLTPISNVSVAPSRMHSDPIV